MRMFMPVLALVLGAIFATSACSGGEDGPNGGPRPAASAIITATPALTRTPQPTGTPGLKPTPTPTAVPIITATTSGPALAFVRDGDVWLINADGSDERRLTQWGDVERYSGAVRWAPTGDLIAALRSSLPPAVESEYRVTVIDLVGNTVLDIPDAGTVTWLPSGLLAYASPSGWGDDWTVVDLHGKELQKLSDAWLPSWSPDESKIAYGRIVDEVGLYPAAVPVVLSVATGGAWEVDPVSQSAARLGPPTFSPDGRWLSYQYDLFDVATHEKRPLPGLQVSWSPDSRYLTLLLGERYDRLAVYDVEKESVVWQDDFLFPATDAPPALAVQGTWSPDGTRFLYLQSAVNPKGDETRVVEIATGRVDTLRDVEWPISISAGGRHIAYSTGRYWPLGGELWVVEMDGTGRTRLPGGVDPTWRPVPTP